MVWARSDVVSAGVLAQEVVRWDLIPTHFEGTALLPLMSPLGSGQFSANTLSFPLCPLPSAWGKAPEHCGPDPEPSVSGCVWSTCPPSALHPCGS